MIIISIKRIVQLALFVLAATALFVFYKTYGVSLSFLLIMGLLALKFLPVLVIPVIILAIGVYFSGDFSFIPDTLILLPLAIPFCLLADGCLKHLQSWWEDKLK